MKSLNASFEGKKNFKLPDGATIVSKKVNMQVREIENGFIIDKTFDIKYLLNGDSNYEYFTKTWYSKENPIEIKDDSEINLEDKL